MTASNSLCLDCRAPLSPERALDFEVCVPCFEKRLAKWVAADPNPRKPLAVQEALIGGKTLADLECDHAINSYEHPSLPLTGLKYGITHERTPIVRECRGLVLERETWRLAAKPFDRFLNAGEDPEGFARFDWSDFTCQTKEDGSLIIVYRYAGEWHANTSGSFGLGVCGFSGMTWRDLFWSTANLDTESLDESLTYCFELCTPYNKVVRSYAKPEVFLLAAFETATRYEFHPSQLPAEAKRIRTRSVPTYPVRGEGEIRELLAKKEASDPTFEGVVIRDWTGLRFKIKTKTYLELHHLHDNGNLFDPRRIVPILLRGERDEVLAYFPEGREVVEKTEADLERAFCDLVDVWGAYHTLEGQKDFAMAVKAHPFASLLFALRKTKGANQTVHDIRALWRESADVIVKRLYP